MWGLEYLLLFGLPKNKLEVLSGKTRCVFPFLTRTEAEAHFAAWLEHLARWRGVSLPEVVDRPPRREAVVDEMVLALFPLPIELRVPINLDILHALEGPFARRDFWEGQPPGKETGRDRLWDHGDVALNLWQFFRQVTSRMGGTHGGRSGVILPDTAAVEPDQYYFRPDRKPRMIRDGYVWDVPDLITEVLSPVGRVLDHGPRMEVYRRAGVAHLWLVDPLVETLEVYALEEGCYVRAAKLHAGETYRSPLFPEVPLAVHTLFDTQSKRHGDRWKEEPEPIPAWLLPPETRVGLEYFLLAGHPERRYEIWGDRAPCVLAFGSPEEAAARLRGLVEDAARWEALPPVQPLTLEPELEVAEIGRFRFTRRGRIVHLKVAVELEQYRLLLDAWASHEAWDWGESPFERDWNTR